MMEPKLLVYVVTNKVNNKQYVGITKRGLKVRKANHLGNAKAGLGFRFHQAIRKYGEENFEWEVVHMGKTVEELLEKEIELIAELDTYNNGYNMTLGGEGIIGLVGEAHGMAVITKEQALRIGWLIQNTTMTYSEIAQEVGCNVGNVKDVACGNGWTYLFPNPPYKNRPHGARIKIDDNKAQAVIGMLHNTTSSYNEIALVCETTEATVMNIANGFSFTHLYEVAPRFNRPKGTRACFIKMDEEKAKLIIQEIYNPNKTYKQIADEFGVSESNVKIIASGKSWKELYDIPPAKVRSLRNKWRKSIEKKYKVKIDW